MTQYFSVLLTVFFLPIVGATAKLNTDIPVSPDNIEQFGAYYVRLTQLLLDQPDFEGDVYELGHFIKPPIKLLRMKSADPFDIAIWDILHKATELRRKDGLPLHSTILLPIHTDEVCKGVILLDGCRSLKGLETLHEDLVKDYDAIFTGVRTNWHEMEGISLKDEDKKGYRLFAQNKDNNPVFCAEQLIKYLAKKRNLNQHIYYYNANKTAAVELVNQKLPSSCNLSLKGQILAIDADYFDVVNNAFKFVIN
jgi:hypothetical protein